MQLAKTDKVGIIVCKYFHDIHSELLTRFIATFENNTTLGAFDICLCVRITKFHTRKHCEFVSYKYLSRPSKTRIICV